MLDPALIAVIALFGAAGAVVIRVSAGIAKQTVAARRALAARLRMIYLPGSWDQGEAMTGVLEGLSVSVRWVSSTLTEITTHNTEYELAGLPPALVLRPEGFGVGSRRLGDEAFDKAVYLRSAGAEWGVFFDPALRVKALELIALGARIGDGKLSLSRSGHEREERVETQLRQLLGFASSIANADRELPALLARAVEQQATPRALRLMIDHFPSSKHTVEVCQWALASGEPELVISGAIGLGATETLSAMLTDVAAPLPIRVRALGGLLRLRALEARHEPVLLELLQADLPRAKRAAAIALGRAGTVAAVPALKECQTGLLGDLELTEAATDAVRRIQARALGAEAGQLSLAESEGVGALSVALEAGAMSLSEDEPA